MQLRVNLTKTGNSRDFMAGGWHAAEGDGSWTQRGVARLRLPKPADSTDYRCVLLYRPYVRPPALTAQRFAIEVAGTVVHEGVATSGGSVTFDFPAKLLAGQTSIDIAIRTPDAMSPGALGAGADVRQLGLCIREFTLEWQGTPLAVPVAAGPPPPKLAVVTMAYNEPEFIPIWLKHYSRHVGAEHCYVVDHGSEDGSTDNLGKANRIRIPRSPYDPHQQTRWNSEFCNSLLNWYDFVLYCDADELVVPDPRVAATLLEYCTSDLPEISACIGLNTIHLEHQEPAIDLTRPISAQRRYAFFSSPACKPLLIRRKVQWTPGSHSADAPVTFGHLYMFHLRWFDLPTSLRRLHRTRTMAWVATQAGGHARVEDERFIRVHTGFSHLSRKDDIDFDPESPPIFEFLERVRQSQIGRDGPGCRISLDIWPNALWRLPDRFVGTF